MLVFGVLGALLGLILGPLLHHWVEDLLYEDFDLSIYRPAEVYRPPQVPARPDPSGEDRPRSSAEWSPTTGATLPLAPWTARRGDHLARHGCFEDEYMALPWYARTPVLSLFFASGGAGLRWYDKLPLLPHFIYAVKFSNYRALTRPWHCLRCDRRQSYIERLPPLCWVIHGGRCPGCGARSNPMKLTIELTTAALFGLFAAHFHSTWMLAGYLYLVASFVVCSFIDWKHQIIPDELNTLGLLAGFVYSGLTEVFFRTGVITNDGLQTVVPPGYDYYYNDIHLKAALLGFLAGAGTLWIFGIVGSFLARTNAMGGGDVKLAGFIGAFLGPKAVMVSLFCAALLGACGGVVLLLFGGGKKEDGYTKFAFGPYICLGTLLVMYFGATPLIRAYLDMSARAVQGLLSP